MSNRLKELRDRRLTVTTDLRKTLEEAEAASRDQLDAEARAEFERKEGEWEKLTQQIQDEERQIAREQASAEAAAEAETAAAKPEDDEARELRAFGAWLQAGDQITVEQRATLQAQQDIGGGYIVAPQQFVAQLLKVADNLVMMRQWGTVYPVARAESLGVPTLDTDPNDADWTSEIAAVTEDTAITFGKRELYPHPLSKLIKISNKLLRSAVLPAEQIVRDRMAYKFAITEEKAFLTGTGANQPLGIFTASSDGISTSRDYSTDATTTATSFDHLIGCKYNTLPQYWPRCRWLFSRTAVKNIAQLVDGNGQYIWRESTRVGEPDRLLGFPVFMSEYVPSTFTSGLYIGMFGDFSYYWIADSLSMQVQRLVELYAANNQIGLIGRMELDGMPVLENAFTRVTLG